MLYSMSVVRKEVVSTFIQDNFDEFFLSNPHLACLVFIKATQKLVDLGQSDKAGLPKHFPADQSGGGFRPSRRQGDQGG